MDYKNNKTNHINFAIEQARKSTMKCKYGAVLLHRNKIISYGYNRYTFITTNTESCLLCG